MQKESNVKDPGLAPDGHRKIDWAAEHSPVLNRVRDEYLKDGTFEGLGVGVALPIEAKTAYLTVVLAEAGAEVSVASPGPYFVQDDVAAALAERGVTVYASSEDDPAEADRPLERVLDRVADGRDAVLIDDRAGLTRLAHTTRRGLLPRTRGASEATASGGAERAAMEAGGGCRASGGIRRSRRAGWRSSRPWSGRAPPSPRPWPPTTPAASTSSTTA